MPNFIQINYLDATYESLQPGQKRENKAKMEQCRKEYDQLRQIYR